MFTCIIFALSLFSFFTHPPKEEKKWQNEQQTILQDLSHFPGWCSPEKATFIMNHLREKKPKLCVEIGTFGGATLFVIAKTLKYHRKGIVHAIDAWANEEAVKGFPPESSFYKWWSTVNLDEIHKQLIPKFKSFRNCYIHKTTSQQAVSLFHDNTIEFLVIDGNHSENGILSDIILYYPKVKEGGYILLNDANWLSARRALVYLLENTELCSPYGESAPFLLFKKDYQVKRIADQLWR